jgi:hypothetical protein
MVSFDGVVESINGQFFFIYILGHFSPLPHTSSLSPMLPLPSIPSLPGKNCSALVFNFVEERV